METKYTPGPPILTKWYYERTNGRNAAIGPRYAITFPDHGVDLRIATVGNSKFTPDANLANARLIAAAPSMLEALKAVLEVIRPYLRQGGIPDEHDEVGRPWLTSARAIINSIEKGE